MLSFINMSGLSHFRCMSSSRNAIKGARVGIAALKRFLHRLLRDSCRSPQDLLPSSCPPELTGSRACRIHRHRESSASLDAGTSLTKEGGVSSQNLLPPAPHHLPHALLVPHHLQSPLRLAALISLHA